MQAARVSLVGHSHVPVLRLRTGTRRPPRDGTRQGAQAGAGTRARPLRGPLADQPRQRRTAPRRRPPRRLAGARHRRLGGHLPPRRVRHRPRRRRDHRERAARAPGEAALRGAVRALGTITTLAAMPGTKPSSPPACPPRRRRDPVRLRLGRDQRRDPADDADRALTTLRRDRSNADNGRTAQIAADKAQEFEEEVNALPSDLKADEADASRRRGEPGDLVEDRLREPPDDHASTTTTTRRPPPTRPPRNDHHGRDHARPGRRPTNAASGNGNGASRRRPPQDGGTGGSDGLATKGGPMSAT